MKIDDFVKSGAKKLRDASIGTARLDVLVLLSDELKKDKTWILANAEYELSSTQISRLNGYLERRVKHEPLSYIRGFSEFYGRNFKIDERVLEPRPESETMIEILNSITKMDELEESELQIVDVGTGSGALAITAKLGMPDANVIAIDIDPKCLDVARQNASSHNTKIEFFKGNLLVPLTISNSKLVTILLCNLPYVPDSFQINEAALREPKIAIFGGADGLDLYRKLFEQIKSMDAKPKYVLTESLPPQHKKLSEIAKKFGYVQTAEQDFIQAFKIN